MKLAIVGANGFIGSRVVESFQLGEGPTVVAIGRRAARLVPLARFALELRVADGFDAVALTRAFAGCQMAISSVRVPEAEIRRHVTALCHAAAQAEVRRLVLLSCAAPDLGPEIEAFYFAECRRNRINGHLLRTGLVYGPRSPLVARIATDLQRRRATLPRSAGEHFDGVYVDNLIAAIRVCLKAKTPAHAAWVVSEPDPPTWREFYDALAHELDLGGTPVHSVDQPIPGGKPSPSRVSPDRNGLGSVPRVPGYAPVVPFAESVRRTAAWWRFAQGEFAPTS